MNALIAGLILTQAGRGLPTNPISLEGILNLKGELSSISTQEFQATVFLFIAAECPIANRYAPEIGRIYSEYSPKKVQFFRVYIDPLERADEFKKHGEDYNLKMPALLDPNKALVKATGVRVTPEAVVLNSKGVMKYRGRIDDMNIEHGKVREGYRRDLRVALDEILAGKVVSMPEATAIGCYIPGD